MYIQILLFKKSMQVPEMQVCLMCGQNSLFGLSHKVTGIYSVINADLLSTAEDS